MAAEEANTTKTPTTTLGAAVEATATTLTATGGASAISRSK